MRLSSSAGAAAAEAAGAALALGSVSALLWEAWAAFALGARFLGTAAAAAEPLHAAVHQSHTCEHSGREGDVTGGVDSHTNIP